MRDRNVTESAREPGPSLVETTRPERLLDPRLRSPDRRAADYGRAEYRRGDMRLQRSGDRPRERLKNRAYIRYDGRKRVVRGTQNTIRDVHIVEMSCRDRPTGVMYGVFAVR